MTHAELTRDLQLEHARLLDRLSEARVLLAQAKGMMEADKAIDAKCGSTHLTQTGHNLLESITAYLKVGLFDQLPEGIER